MASLLAELKRRNVYKVTFAYLILGWLVLQITDIVAPALRLPEWTMSLVTYLGLIGFPFAILFTWAFELTPDALKRTADVDPEQSITGKTGQTLNGVIIAMLVMAVAFLLLDKFFLGDTGIDAPVAETAEPAAEEPAQPGATDKPRSIAVLPFVNMSNDPDQEYFSDGISEELLNGLAKIQELRVAARTSSFAFKGQNQDITDIGEQLKVETVLEGSVRKAGQRVRITAQLINVEDGYHLWSETYDRELNDIFAIQDEISKAIVDALKVHLTDIEVVAGGAKRPVNLDAYNFYLLARHNMRQRSQASLENALLQYQKAIDLDPGYAAAWGGKATATELLSTRHYGDIPVLEARDEAQKLIDVALRLEPDNPDALMTQALIDLNHYDAYRALDAMERALAANPSEGILLNWKAQSLIDLGRYSEGMAVMEEAFRADPLHRVNRRNLAMQYAFEGKSALAREMAARGEAAYFEIESFIAMTEGRFADRERILTEAISVANDTEAGLLGVARGFNRAFQLGEVRLDDEAFPPSAAIAIQAAVEPAQALPRIEQLPESSRGWRTMRSHVYALHRLERYQEMLDVMADMDILQGPIYGDPGVPISHFSFAVHYSFALYRLGRIDEAQELARRLQVFANKALSNGQPPDFQWRLAALNIVLGEPDAAIGALRIGLQRYDLSWAWLNGPWFAELHGREEFEEIRSAWYAHANNERAKLGWQPLEVAAL